MKKKEILANFLIRTRLYKPASFFYSNILSPVTVLAYHRIKNIDSDYVFDKNLISASVDVFEEQVAYVNKYFNPISCEELAYSIRNNKKLPKKSVLITFDDGFDDNYHSAYKILHSYSVPATFFISSGYIDSQLPYWFDWMYMIYENMVGQNMHSDLVKLLTDFGYQHNGVVNEMLYFIRKLDNSKREAIVSGLIDSCEKEGIEIRSEYCKPMTWSQVREMSDNGYDIGSHTVNHPILSTCTEDEMIYELAKSKERIESNIEKEVISVAYPVGSSSAYNNKTVKFAEKL
ncbi:MAG: polysaccharide deacetylase family protein, partial [Gammaproteobacteria bacterium]|nr:polysaccharide deacetylase family protein [Gammaproteobacteria bacterium]